MRVGETVTCTPSTNVDIDAIAKLLLEGENFAICGHTSPDGDCIGSTLAMKAMLDALGKRSWALVADSDFVPDPFEFMPGCDALQFAGDFNEPIKAFIAVDVPNDMRLGKYGAAVAKTAPTTITIDHHESDKNSSTYRYIDPDSASCTLIIWKIALRLLEACSDEVFTDDVMRKIATCCYAGLLTDTGRFMFQNTDEDCFACAKEMVETGIDISSISSKLFQEKTLASIKLNALVSDRMKVLDDGRIVMSWLTMADLEDANATNADTEDCINVIRALKGALVACMLKERNGAVRGSLRSKDGTNVAAIASEFGGGGHAAAAGFTMNCDLPEAIEKVTKRLCALDFDQPSCE